MWWTSHSSENWARLTEPAALSWAQACLVIGLLSALCWMLLIAFGWALWSAL
jgi:hypothetical protein